MRALGAIQYSTCTAQAYLLLVSSDWSWDQSFACQTVRVHCYLYLVLIAMTRNSPYFELIVHGEHFFVFVVLSPLAIATMNAKLQHNFHEHLFIKAL
jgi:hypothetical protein